MPLAELVGGPPLAASRTTQPLIVEVCGALAASLFGSGLSGVRPRLVCAAATVVDSRTAARVAPSFALALLSPRDRKNRVGGTRPNPVNFRQISPRPRPPFPAGPRR